MSLFGCNSRCSCTGAAVIASAIVGVLAAFLQITGVITVTSVFLWVAFGIAVAYLGVLAVSVSRCQEQSPCRCTALNALLVGLLGTILLALILLSVGIVATSVISAILVGLLLFFLALAFGSAACYVRAATRCEN